MKKHEKYCTANPMRECRTCNMNPNIYKIIEDFKARFTLVKNERLPLSNFSEDGLPNEYTVTWIGSPATLTDVINSVDGCPACVLAILRQTGFNRHYFEFEKYDYQKEMLSTMQERNQEIYNSNWSGYY